jgi:hypothetical protein
VTDIYWYDALPLAVFGSASSTPVNLLDLLTNVYDAGARRVKFSLLAAREPAPEGTLLEWGKMTGARW